MTGPCRLYREVCAALAPARSLYSRLASILGLPGHREALAAQTAADRGDPGVLCGFLWEAVERIPGGRVCVLGPLPHATPGGCDYTLAVEAPHTVGADAVFTDRDSGPVPVEEGAAYRYWLVHVHGDNFWEPRDPAGMVVYTSQALCHWPVLGLGGFTDGDRPVALAMALGAEEVVLHGYDLARPYCGHKLAWDCGWKRLKLWAASTMLSWLARAYGYEQEARWGVIVFKRGSKAQ